MEYVMVKIIFILCFNSISQLDSQMLRKEAYMSVPKLIVAAGYPAEKHRVITPDGYSLQMHRIPAGRRTARRTDSGGKSKKAVLIQHGLVGSSGDFVIMGPERSLAYLLADAGYDVWLGNYRGNLYTTHLNLTRSDPAFWEFSFHEHGKYDIPAMIDKVLSVTGLEKVLYIGHSMGSTGFFTMMSERPEYNDKVVAFVALAPAVYMDNIKGLATLLLTTLNLPSVLRSRGMVSLTLSPQLIEFILGGVCGRSRPRICLEFVYSFVGEDYEQNDWALSQTAMARMQPASWRQLEHFGKVAITGEFLPWAGGARYNLSRVRAPVTLLYGDNDLLTHKTQILRLAEELKKSGVLEEVRPGCSWPKFNHLDFVFAKDVGTLLNKPLIKHIDHLYNKYG